MRAHPVWGQRVAWGAARATEHGDRTGGRGRSAVSERLELDVSITDDLVLEAHARSLMAGEEDRCRIHNLEFGLEFPGAETEGAAGDGSAGASDAGPTDEAGAQTMGAIGIRANVADREDVALVPGEFLYQYDQHYFDRRCDPPAEQDHERLYYEACAGCGRASNDPACHCGLGQGSHRQ